MVTINRARLYLELNPFELPNLLSSTRVKICTNCSEITDNSGVKHEVLEGDATVKPDVADMNRFLELAHDDCPPLVEEGSGVDDDDFEYDVKQELC